MFDVKEIADRALARAAEIQAEKKRRRRRAYAVCVFLGAVTIVTIATLIGAQGNRLSPSGNIQIADPLVPMAAGMVIPAGSIDVGLTLTNPVDNQCKLAYSIILAETGEPLYISDIISPSERIEQITLLRPLPEGRHKAVLSITVYGQDALAPTSRMDLTFDLIAASGDGSPYR